MCVFQQIVYVHLTLRFKFINWSNNNTNRIMKRINSCGASVLCGVCVSVPDFGCNYFYKCSYILKLGNSKTYDALAMQYARIHTLYGACTLLIHSHTRARTHIRRIPLKCRRSEVSVYMFKLWVCNRLCYYYLYGACGKKAHCTHRKRTHLHQ